MYRYDIAAKLAPIKDVFLVLFFVGLGMHIGVEGIMDHIYTIIWLMVCVIVIKPLLIA
jgi:Kef-type K+ transport system membrane component KefB